MAYAVVNDMSKSHAIVDPSARLASFCMCGHYCGLMTPCFATEMKISMCMNAGYAAHIQQLSMLYCACIGLSRTS